MAAPRRKMRVVSLDYDGCVGSSEFVALREQYKYYQSLGRADQDYAAKASDAIIEANQVLFDEIAKNLPDEIIVGSARQDDPMNRGNAAPRPREDGTIRSGNGCCYEAMEKIVSYFNHKKSIPCRLNRYLLADTDFNHPPGYTFDNARKGEFPSFDICHQDQFKIRLLYAQMHKMASENKDADITFDFYDDRIDILLELHRFFTENPDLKPGNVTLNLNKWDGETLNPQSFYGPTFPRTVPQNSAEIDYNYEENIKTLATRCLPYGPDKENFMQIPLEEILWFRENRITTKSGMASIKESKPEVRVPASESKASELLNQGKALFTAEKYQESIAKIGDALAAGCEPNEGNFQLARAYRRNIQYEKAREHYKQVKPTAISSADKEAFHNGYALALAETGQYNEAIKQLDLLARERITWEVRTKISQKRDDYQNKLETLELLKEGRRLFKANEFRRSITELYIALSKCGASLYDREANQISYELARALRRDNQPDKACQYYQQVTVSDPNIDINTYRMGYARALAATGKYGEATYQLEQTSSRASVENERLGYSAKHLAGMRQYAAAIKDLDTLLGRTTDMDLQTSIVIERRGYQEKLDKELLIAKNNHFYRLAEQRRRQGQDDKACEVYAKINPMVRITVPGPDYRIGYANLLFYAGKYAEATKQLDLLILSPQRKDIKDIVKLRNKCLTLTILGKYISRRKDEKTENESNYNSFFGGWLRSMGCDTKVSAALKMMDFLRNGRVDPPFTLKEQDALNDKRLGEIMMTHQKNGGEVPLFRKEKPSLFMGYAN